MHSNPAIITALVFGIVLPGDKITRQIQLHDETTNTWSVAGYKSQIQTGSIVADTGKLFETDDYPVTSKMLNDGERKKKSGPVVSMDKAWFKNDSLGQTLVYELYTDGFRETIFHFYNNDIPPELINYMDLSDKDGNSVSNSLKQKYLPGILKYARPVAARYFKSKKGFVLGDPKSRALKVYGKPDKVSITGNIEMCRWEFQGEEYQEHKTKKPLAIDSFGYQVTMFFRNNRLIGVIIHNDIP